MKILLLGVFFSFLAEADTLRFKTTSDDARDLIHAKNCLDYRFCLPTNTSLKKLVIQNKIQYLFSVSIKMDPALLPEVVQECGLAALKNKLKIYNTTTQKEFDLLENNPKPNTFRSDHKNISIHPSTLYTKAFHFLQLRHLLKKKHYQEAIDYVVNAFEFKTFEHRLRPDLTLNHYSITEHAKKEIRIGTDFLAEPCILILGIRHELEHAQQYAQANTCRAQNKYHNFQIHRHRERTAYLNDVANLSNYCPLAYYSNPLRENALDQLFTRFGDL